MASGLHEKASVGAVTHRSVVFASQSTVGTESSVSAAVASPDARGALAELLVDATGVGSAETFASLFGFERHPSSNSAAVAASCARVADR